MVAEGEQHKCWKHYFRWTTILDLSNHLNWKVLYRFRMKAQEFREIYLIYEKFKIWLIDRLGYRASQIVVILDNWAFHRSNRSINYLKNSNLKILFLPPYTPQMASVELFFSLLKGMLKKHSKAQRIKIARHEGAELLKYCWNEISARDIIRFFRHSAKSLRIHFLSLSFKKN